MYKEYDKLAKSKFLGVRHLSRDSVSSTEKSKDLFFIRATKSGKRFMYVLDY